MNFFNVSSAIELRQSMLNTAVSEPSESSIKMHDATVFSRVGFRGKGVEGFLVSQGLPIPHKPNQSELSESGALILRLSMSEFWIIDTDNSHYALIQALELASQGVSGVYRLYCQHSHSLFLVKGNELPKMFAKVCGVDLSNSAFIVAYIAQTSVARVNAIVVRQILNGEEVFLLLSDLASSQFLWDAIDDARAEFI